MSLTPGQTIAHYRIDRKIGEGGMGEVYAATDTRLNRPAAIKAMPAALAAEPERLARFKREAQLLAALSHPNIAGIYGLEQVGDASYLALELVEGDDLSNRIEGRAVPHDEAVEVALQIAAALDGAHEKGIIHRDLKPANIKIDGDGKIKVLDFGLAKALSDDPDGETDSVSLTTSPTLTAVMGTQVGSILGTAGYMAPEQARGKKVDRRADIWAFGVILFEMLTGKQMFTGETVTDVIAQVVTREPDWEQLPADTPPTVRRVLRRCLQKDPRKRLRDIGDAALELGGEFAEDDPAAATGAQAGPAPSRAFAWFLGAAGLALGLILATVVAMTARGSGETSEPVWTNLAPPVGVEIAFGDLIEISPDGSRVLFVAEPREGGERMLWVRELGTEQVTMLTGTEGAMQPFWSPDSQSIAFFADRKLRRINLDGTPPIVLDNGGDAPRGGCWGDDGTILFGPDWSEPLYRVPATGGNGVAVTELDPDRFELSHRWPHMLPDNKHFLYYAVSTYPSLNPENPSAADKSGLYLGSLDGGEPRFLQDVRSRAVYIDGNLMYVDDNVLTARAFDLDRLEFSGEPVALVNDVTQSASALWGGALFSVSDNGRLLFVRGAPESRWNALITWTDRAGNLIETTGEQQPYNDLALSNDDRRLAMSIGDPADIWIHDLERDVRTRLTFDPGNEDSPIWSPNGDEIVFTADRIIAGQEFIPGNLFRKTASGQDQGVHLPMTERSPNTDPSDWAPDGERLALMALNPKTGADIVIYSLGQEASEPWLAQEGDEQNPKFSPDGRWLAYSSSESGSIEIYVAAFPGPGGKWQVSTAGGTMPHWRADGRELFYVTEDDEVMAVPVELDGGFRHGKPVMLFQAPEILRTGTDLTWDVASDGQRFVFLARSAEDGDEIGVAGLVQGWTRLLE